MKTIEIEVSEDFTKTWKIKDSSEYIQLVTSKFNNNEEKNFYHLKPAGVVLLQFPASEAAEYLQLCDEAISNGLHAIPVANIHNTSFLSMVLTQFLHVPKVVQAIDEDTKS